MLVRQRPGIGNAIFMTLEDETGIANTILWPRTFEQFRPVIMGSRLIGVSGRAAEREGRHPHRRRSVSRISRRCCNGCRSMARRIDPTAPTDEVKRPVQGSWRHPRKTLSPVDMARADNPDRFRHPRSGDSFVRLAKHKPAMEPVAAVEHAAKVMPKGRNFH